MTIDIFAYLTDIDVDNPDKKLIIMYLTELYNYLEGSKAKERVCIACSNHRVNHKIIISVHLHGEVQHIPFKIISLAP